MTTFRSEFPELARRYGALGWALVRLEGKVPKGSGWQQTQPDPDPDHLAGLWAEYGKRWNVGVVLGPSNVAVVEYDTEAGGRRLLELFGGKPPPTPTCRTGSERLHFYFTPPAGFEKRARDGIELRVGAHQCVLPPSVHPDTGKPYRWVAGREPWSVPLAAVPAAVLDYFSEAHSNGTGPAAPLPELIPIGRIDDTLASLAGSMRRRNASEEAIYAALVETLKHCEPGHTHTEADCRRIARSIASKDPAEQPEPFVLELRSARELCALPDPEHAGEIVGPLVVLGARTIVLGHTGAGKSTLISRVIAAAVEGAEFLAWEAEGGLRALLIDLEQSQDNAKRMLREAGLDQSEAVGIALVPDGLELDRDDVQLAAVEHAIVEGGFRIVVFDPYYKAHRAEDANAERQIDDLMRRLDGLRAAHGFALILGAHPRKPPVGVQPALTIHDLAGSGAAVRGAEIIVAIERVNDGYSRLRFLKDRAGRLPVGDAWGLLFEREGGYRRDPNDGKTRDIRAELLEALAAGEWRTVTELRRKKDAGGIGADPETIRPALDALTAEGLLEHRVGPAGRQPSAKCWRVSSGRDDTDDTTAVLSLSVNREESGVVVSSPYKDDTTTTTPTPPDDQGRSGVVAPDDTAPAEA